MEKVISHDRQPLVFQAEFKLHQEINHPSFARFKVETKPLIAAVTQGFYKMFISHEEKVAQARAGVKLIPELAVAFFALRGVSAGVQASRQIGLRHHIKT
jgi:hypothetical protein